MKDNKTNLFFTIIGAGLFVGFLDGLAAIIQTLVNGGNPEKVFQFIASGVFGTPAFSGGIATVIYGIFFHLAIALIWTLIFFVIYRNLKALSKSIVLTGTLYGILVWAVMTRLVLPLSNAPAIPFAWRGAVISILILIAAVGLPLSFLAHRYYVPNSK